MTGDAQANAKNRARAKILGGIGPGRAADLAAEYADLPHDYIREGALSPAERLDLLEHRLREYDAAVYRCTPQAIPGEIARILTARGKSRIGIPAGLPPHWLPPNFAFLLADEFSPQQLDDLDGLLSGCTVAIAATGTLVLQNAPAQGTRKLSLVPDYHLCVVDAAQVVETVPQAFALLAPTMLLPTTFISGPSATADIEMTRIKGVHGPRFLDVILTA